MVLSCYLIHIMKRESYMQNINSERSPLYEERVPFTKEGWWNTQDLGYIDLWPGPVLADDFLEKPNKRQDIQLTLGYLSKYTNNAVAFLRVIHAYPSYIRQRSLYTARDPIKSVQFFASEDRNFPSLGQFQAALKASKGYQEYCSKQLTFCRTIA